MDLNITLNGFLAIACFFLAVMFLTGFARNIIKKLIRQTTNVYDNKNKYFFTIVFLMLLLGIYFLTANIWFVIIAPVPLLLIVIYAIIASRRKK